MNTPKKPKKKEPIDYSKPENKYSEAPKSDVGYNECYNQMEAFLPSEEELRRLLVRYTRENWKEDYTCASKAIHARLRGAL